MDPRTPPLPCTRLKAVARCASTDKPHYEVANYFNNNYVGLV